MSSARSFAMALIGLNGEPVVVETHIANGLPAFILIGLPDTALGEARDRVRAALQSTGCALPAQRVTVNLSPASLRKFGSGFDLSIAIAVLAGNGVIEAAGLERTVHVGELGLDGSVRAVPGVLPVVSAAARAGFARVMVPAECADEARLIPGIEVVPVGSLRAAALHYGADAAGLAEFEPDGAHPALNGRQIISAELERREQEHRLAPTDLADVVGNDEAVRALLVAAAGRHHLLMLGPPGSGKTMLAERLIDVLPDLDTTEAIEVAAIRSLCRLPVDTPLSVRPPLEAPHHTASKVALLGGGSGIIRPGAVSLASGGVLFLDEATEFQRTVLDSMRQSLESGTHKVHRGAGIAEFPARYQLVLAANPCPCGNADSPGATCTCTARVRNAYMDRLSGPLLDRIDLQLRVERVSAARRRVAEDLRASGQSNAMTTARARALVTAAREAAAHRLKPTPWRTNAEVRGTWLHRAPMKLPKSALVDLENAYDKGVFTMRGRDRVLRVAWSIADLEGASSPTRAHVREALYYRNSMKAAA